VKVGIEHPILGLMTFTLIAAMVVSAIVLLGMVGMNVQDYILKTPVTEGYTTCFSFDSGTGRYKYNVSIAVANSGRVDLRLEKLYVATEKGLVELTVASQYTVRREVTVGDAVVDFEIILLGFTRDTELWAGQRGLIRINMVSDKQLYMTGGQYSVTAYLTTIDFEAFTVREARFKVGELEGCPPTTPPPPLVPLDIVRVSRAALYWDTFDTDPIVGGKVTLVGACHPSSRYVPSGYNKSGLVLLRLPNSRGECALIVQGVVLPNTGTIYVAFTSLLLQADPPIRDTGSFGAILVRDATGLANYYAGGFNESADKLFIRVKIGTPSDNLSRSTYTVDFNKWYNGALVLSYLLPNVPGYIAFYASPNTSLTTYTFKSLGSHEWLTPLYVGLILIKQTVIQHTGAYFDNILVTVGERPWIVRVESLQPGWRVVLKDSSGRIIDSGVAGLGGVVELNVWGIWIIKDGVIELYDSSNNLLIRKSFSEILGGDVYRVTG
jgi:hypothetical protein